MFLTIESLNLVKASSLEGMCGDDDDDGIFAVKQKSYEKVSLKNILSYFFFVVVVVAALCLSRKFQVCENIYLIIFIFIEIIF